MTLLVAFAWAAGAGLLAVATTPWARRHEARYERLRESLLDVPGSYPLLAALVVFLAALRWGRSWPMTAFALTLVGAAALSLVDLATHRLPNRMLYPTALAGVGALVVAALATGHAGSLLLVPPGLVLGMLPYALIWLFRPAGMGFGDVRMAGMLGAVTAALGLDAVVVMLFAAALSSAVVGVAALIALRRQVPYPQGPFLAAGALTAIVLG
jgi:leader peptidase (prepilin peptidase)/N-methyltransferase